MISGGPWDIVTFLQSLVSPNPANERNFLIQNICLQVMVFTSFCITYDQIERQNGAFRLSRMIKTALADFLGHPTSRAGADALRAYAWLSP
jgi:hypothetical protein